MTILVRCMHCDHNGEYEKPRGGSVRCAKCRTRLAIMPAPPTVGTIYTKDEQMAMLAEQVNVLRHERDEARHAQELLVRDVERLEDERDQLRENLVDLAELVDKGRHDEALSGLRAAAGT